MDARETQRHDPNHRHVSTGKFQRAADNVGIIAQTFPKRVIQHDHRCRQGFFLGQKSASHRRGHAQQGKIVRADKVGMHLQGQVTLLELHRRQTHGRQVGEDLCAGPQVSEVGIRE